MSTVAALVLSASAATLQQPAKPGASQSAPRRDPARVWAEVRSSATVSSGLELDPPALDVVIESLSKDAARIGLTEDRLRTKVQLRLQRAGIKIGAPRGDALYLRVSVDQLAFSTELKLFRADCAYFTKGRLYVTVGSTWDIDSFGTHGQSADGIVSVVDQLMDEFLNEFLIVNSK